MDNKVKIIIVEDQPVCRLGIRMTLGSSSINHQILNEFGMASQAIEYLEKSGQEVDLILLDYVLPDGTGMDVIQTVKRLGLKAKIVIFSGEAGGAILKHSPY